MHVGGGRYAATVCRLNQPAVEVDVAECGNIAALQNVLKIGGVGALLLNILQVTVNLPPAVGVKQNRRSRRAFQALLDTVRCDTLLFQLCQNTRRFVVLTQIGNQAHLVAQRRQRFGKVEAHARHVGVDAEKRVIDRVIGDGKAPDGDGGFDVQQT